MNSNELSFHDLKLTWYHFPATAGDARRPMLFFHANGYPARTYTPLFERINAAGRDVFALDFMGHGRSQATEDFRDWNFFRDQVLALLNHLTETGRVDAYQGVNVVGHSIGGASSSLATALEEQRAREAGRPSRIRALGLLDPTVLTPAISLLLPFAPNHMARAAEKRRNEFKSLKIVARSYRMHPGFKDWRDDVFQAYLESAFRQRDDGMFELCLPPRIEARIFRSLHSGQWRAHKAVAAPKLVIQAHKSTVTPDRAARLLVQRNRASRRIASTGSHFFPMEQPDWTVERILEYFAEIDSRD